MPRTRLTTTMIIRPTITMVKNVVFMKRCSTPSPSEMPAGKRCARSAAASASPSSPARRRSASGRRAAPLGQLAPMPLGIGLDQQGMVMPDRHRQAEQGLQQAVDVAGGEQVGTARDQRDAVRRIVQRGGEVIGCRGFLAQQHDIAELLRRGALFAGQFVHPAERPGPAPRPWPYRAARQRLARIDLPCPGRCPDRSAHPARRPWPQRQFRRGCIGRDRAGPSPSAARPPPHS